MPVAEALALLGRIAEADRRRQKMLGTGRAEAVIELTMATEFKREGKLLVARLAHLRDRFPTSMPTEALGRRDWEPLFDKVAGQTDPAMIRGTTRGIAIAMSAGGNSLVAHLQRLPVSFDLKNPRAVAYLKRRGAELVSGVNATTRSYLQTVIAEAVENGWSYDRTARAITARYSEFAVGSPLRHIASRAHLIAVTESAFAYEQGNVQAVSQLTAAGIGMVKSWMTVGDGRVDLEQCGPNEEEGWIPVDASFGDGSDVPPAHPGCRCTTGYQVAGAL